MREFLGGGGDFSFNRFEHKMKATAIEDRKPAGLRLNQPGCGFSAEVGQ
jgi:hypothetical protein